MDEKDFNRVIISNFNRKVEEMRVRWGHKIADPGKFDATTTSKRPFDGFTVGEYIIYFESKLVKNGYKAWAFDSMREHQIDNLSTIKRVAEHYGHEKVLPLVFVAFWESRKIYEFFVFDIDFIIKTMTTGKKSFNKKELLAWKEKGLAIPIKKETYCIPDIHNKIIDSF